MESCRDHKKKASHRAPETLQKKESDIAPFVSTQPPEVPTSAIDNPDLAFIFNPLRDQSKPYHMDGDTTMYTESAIAQRNMMKSEPIVEP